MSEIHPNVILVITDDQGGLDPIIIALQILVVPDAVLAMEQGSFPRLEPVDIENRSQR